MISLDSRPTLLIVEDMNYKLYINEWLNDLIPVFSKIMQSVF